jgi:hypothetical protein
MLFLNVIFFSIILLFSSINAMEDRLPGDIIRQVAKLALHDPSWTDIEKAFALQSMARVNKRWLQAIAGLKILDFPYLPIKS